EACMELDGAPESRFPSRLVPLPVDAAPVAGEPAPRAEGASQVDAEAEAGGGRDDALVGEADLEDGGRASAEQLGHREVDAGRGGRVVLRAGADREHLEEPRVEELGRPGVLDERAVEGRLVDVSVRRDEAGSKDVGGALQGG